MIFSPQHYILFDIFSCIVHLFLTFSAYVVGKEYVFFSLFYRRDFSPRRTESLNGKASMGGNSSGRKPKIVKTIQKPIKKTERKFQPDQNQINQPNNRTNRRGKQRKTNEREHKNQRGRLMSHFRCIEV